MTKMEENPLVLRHLVNTVIACSDPTSLPDEIMKLMTAGIRGLILRERDAVKEAFDGIAAANTVTILSLDEMEKVVLHHLGIELLPSSIPQDKSKTEEQPTDAK